MTEAGTIHKGTGDFDTWDINLSDQETRKIYRSHGLIGLKFDERILAGRIRRDELHGAAPNKGGRNTEVWAKLLAGRIYDFAEAASEAVGTEDRWRHLGTGSGFDGAINLVDAYCRAGDLEDLGP